MTKYSKEPENGERTAKARGGDLRCSFKNTRETAMALRGMGLEQAKKYLNQVLKHERCIPFRRYNGHVGRTAQAKEWKTTQGRWPKKSCEAVLNILSNAEANAESKGLDTEKLFISHVQVNQAVKGRRRTFRAHGRINPFMSHPCHVELMLSEKGEGVARAAGGAQRSSKKKLRSGTSMPALE